MTDSYFDDHGSDTEPDRDVTHSRTLDLADADPDVRNRNSAIALSYSSLIAAGVSLVFYVLAPVGALVALITGINALRRWRTVERDRRQGRWAAITGVSLGVILAIMSVIVIGLFITIITAGALSS